MTHAALIVEDRSDRVHVTLNRPEVRNAIDQQTVDELHAVCDRLETAPKLLILSGSGGTFASGADIAQLLERGRDDALKGINTHIFSRIAALPMPVIAAVDGYALGGGAELAYAADFRLASTTAKFGNPEAGLGIIAAAGATWRLPALVGEPLSRQVLLAGRILDANEALAAGLVVSVHEPDALLGAADELAVRILRNDPAALMATKRMLAPGVSHPDAELAEQAVLFESDAKRERMSAFLNRKGTK